MSESESHTKLVKELVTWICIKLLDDDSGYVFADLPENPQNRKPPIINNFVPDVFVPNAPGPIFIIGEAKTARDLETKHTKNQIEAFLNRCSLENNAILIMAVPWDLVRCARSLLNNLKSKVGAKNVEVIVLERLYG